MIGYGAKLARAVASGPAKNILPGPISMFRGEQYRKLTGFVKERGIADIAGNYFEGRNIIRKGDFNKYR